MEQMMNRLDMICVAIFFSFILATNYVTLTEARLSWNFKDSIKSHQRSITNSLDHNPKLSEDTKLNVPKDPKIGKLYDFSSQLSLPPLESLPPLALPDNTPAFCFNPPLFAPESPPPQSYPPILPFQTPPPSPHNNFAGPPTHLPTPVPPRHEPSPPNAVPRPACYGPSPPITSPSINKPPRVYVPPAVAHPPPEKPQYAVWCVAKPTLPDSTLQAALDYACGSGADCNAIRPNGSCFEPNTLLAHASYAFNSYWQNGKAAGGTCDFGGSAMLITTDPSFNHCKFICN